MADYVEGPRLYRITADNHGAKVLAAAYIMMCQTILSVVARAGLKLSASRRWSWDDTSVTIAAIIAVAHTGTMAASFEYGMGRHISQSDAVDWSSLERSFYAANVLYITAIVLAKMSVLLFIKRLTPSRGATNVCWVIFGLLAAWGSSALFVTLFACGLPSPWQFEYEQCIDLAAFTRATSIIDMVTDVLLVVLPIHLFARLNYAGSGRWTVVTVFSMRALILIPDIFRYLSIDGMYNIKPIGHLPWDSVSFQIWSTVAMHFSVISASIPCVRPFLRSLESGLYDASLRIHPRLARRSEEAEKNFMLMTLGDWSARKGEPADGSVSTQTTQAQPLKESRSNSRSGSEEISRSQSITSEAEFSRKLHPEVSEHRTNIQISRTYPQFGGKLSTPSPECTSIKLSKESRRWDDIAVTKETRIRFEEEGVVLQELKTKVTNI